MRILNTLCNKNSNDNKAQSDILYSLSLINELKSKDPEFFMGMLIFGMNKKGIVNFKKATSIYFNVIY